MVIFFPIVLLLISIAIAIKIAEKKYIKTEKGSQTIINSLRALINFTLFGLFIYAFYIRFYKWIDCYNENGRYYDPISQEVYTESGMLWIIPALFFLFFGMKRIFNVSGVVG